jgi:hypothetical protein
MRNDAVLAEYTSRFQSARTSALSECGIDKGVGTLSEKLLHRVLKYTVEPREEYHELAFLGSVADIRNENGITEIQTKNLIKLLPKLKKLLPKEKVTVIIPIIHEKNLAWLDPATGELLEKRRSPRRGRLSDALPELASISELLGNENLVIRIIMLDVDEYKLLDGYGKDGKHRATKLNRIPNAIVNVIDLRSPGELCELLPTGLEASFTSAELLRSLGLRSRKTSFAKKLLLTHGIIERIGTDGRAHLYKIADYVNKT